MSKHVAQRQRSIRIAVSGTHSVGKTTFCADLGAALRTLDGSSHTVEVITNVSRHLFVSGVKVNKETEESEYPLFLEKHISNIFKDWGTDFVVHDRTIIDTIAYGTANGNLHPNWISFLTKAAPHLLRGIDVYFYIPVEFAIEDDGMRSLDTEYQAAVDRAQVAVLQACRPDAITLRGSRDERVARALAIIREQ